MNEPASQPADPPAALPRHVAIVMDGNGRWAQRQGKKRDMGHARGAQRVLPIVERCANLGIGALSLYALSSENLLRRPGDEVDALMQLYQQYLASERQKLIDHNLRFVHAGRRDGLSDRVLEELDRSIEVTAANTGLTLVLALNYGSRQEIVDAVRAIAARRLPPEQIDQKTIDDHLYTAGLPDVDLLIRTAGEMRISNFLLWQISYAEIWVTPTLWPDFTTGHLHEALDDFARRTRRFGAVLR
jgi:undecaprenyl diphosphate synthase